VYTHHPTTMIMIMIMTIPTVATFTIASTTTMKA
jgi:hypothetical protein